MAISSRLPVLPVAIHGAYQAWRPGTLWVKGGEVTVIVDKPIVVDLTTLAGLNDNPGEIPGWGPVISEIARQAAEPEKQWQVTVTDNRGRPVWGGTTRYRPKLTERRQITTTYITCLFPGCRMPSTQSDIDHHHHLSPRSEATGGSTGDGGAGEGRSHPPMLLGTRPLSRLQGTLPPTSAR
jgi:hypothetical protein